LRENFTTLDAVFFTHYHADHIFGIEDLRAFTFGRKEPLRCYADKVTATHLFRIFNYIFDANPNHIGGKLANLTLQVISPGESITVNDIKVTPFLLKHGPTDVFGYRIGNFAYATDCNFIPSESLPYLEGLSALILDGLRYEPSQTHFTIPQAVKMILNLKPGKAYLTHLAHTVEYKEVSARLPENIFLAYDGLVIDFKI
jgi:phosphoribosyl 1,2-cyclic phosphate phosphodiesterase